MLTNKQLAEIKAAYEATTQGEWEARSAGGRFGVWVGGCKLASVEAPNLPRPAVKYGRENNSRFIALIHGYTPLLLAEIERLRQYALRQAQDETPADELMRRTIEVESSQFSPGAYWVNGGEYFAEKVTIEYPVQLDSLTDEELDELADQELRGVRYVRQDQQMRLVGAPMLPGLGE